MSLAERRKSFAKIGLGVLLSTVGTRAVVTYNPVPGWDADPFTQPVVATSLGPGGSAWLEWAMLLGVGLLLVGVRRSCGWLAVLALVGGVAVQARSLLLDAGDAHAIAMASAWTTAWAVFAGGRACAVDPTLRRFAWAACIGLSGMLVAKSTVQIAFEGPSVIANFEADRLAILESRGMDPDGAAAAQYERRLRQTDPTAWFGLSNVLAAILTASAAGLMLAVWHARRQPFRVWVAAGIAGAVACAAGVITTGSKAGPVILTVTLAASLIAHRLPRRLGYAAVLAAIALPTAAVIARGLLGVPDSERSLLFRWFYMLGGAEIVASHPIEGTGPSGFRQAYLLAKPAIAPESVTSTHHALLDWIAMLGVAGWAWAAVTVGCCLRLAATLATRPHARAPSSVRRPVVLMLAAVAAVPTIANAILEVDATTIETALGRIAGLGAWIGLAVIAWRHRPGPHAFAAVGLALLMSAQLDMVLFINTAAPLALLLLGLSLPPKPGTVRLGSVLACVGVAVLLAVQAWHASGLTAYERRMAESARACQRVMVATQQLDPASVSPADQRLINGLFRDAAREAAALLRPLVEDYPNDPAASRALVQALIASGEADGRPVGTERDPASPADGWFSDAIAEAERLAQIRGDAQSFGALGSVLERAAHRRGRSGQDARAGLAYEKAGDLDPTNPLHPYRAARALRSAGRFEQARDWAERALDLDAAMHLDPLAGLTDRMRADARAWADGSR